MVKLVKIKKVILGSGKDKSTIIDFTFENWLGDKTEIRLIKAKGNGKVRFIRIDSTTTTRVVEIMEMLRTVNIPRKRKKGDSFELRRTRKK